MVSCLICILFLLVVFAVAFVAAGHAKSQRLLDADWMTPQDRFHWVARWGA